MSEQPTWSELRLGLWVQLAPGMARRRALRRCLQLLAPSAEPARRGRGGLSFLVLICKVDKTVLRFSTLKNGRADFRCEKSLRPCYSAPETFPDLRVHLSAWRKHLASRAPSPAAAPARGLPGSCRPRSAPTEASSPETPAPGRWLPARCPAACPPPGMELWASCPPVTVLGPRPWSPLPHPASWPETSREKPSCPSHPCLAWPGLAWEDGALFFPREHPSCSFPARESPQ